MMRNLIAILVFPILFFVLSLASLPILMLLLVTLLSWMNFPIQNIDRVVLIPVLSVLFLVPGIISGRIATTKSPLVGGLGAILASVLTVSISASLFPLLPLATQSPDTLSYVLLGLATLVGAIGGFFGAELRDSSTYYSSPVLRQFLLIVAIGILFAFLGVFGIVSFSPRSRVPRALETPVVPSTAVLVSATSTIPVSAILQAAAISPTISPGPIATSVPAPTVALTSFPTQTSLPRGLFIANMRIQPGQPAHNVNVAFFVTFLNTADTIQNFKWRVYIYRADTPATSTTETSFLQTSFPPGTGEYQSLGTFHYGPNNPCDYFFARVGWLDAENKIVFFTQPDGQVYAKGFSVCN